MYFEIERRTVAHFPHLNTPSHSEAYRSDIAQVRFCSEIAPPAHRLQSGKCDLQKPNRATPALHMPQGSLEGMKGTLPTHVPFGLRTGVAFGDVGNDLPGGGWEESGCQRFNWVMTWRRAG